MAIGSFVTGLTNGVFQGMDWREARNSRKRRQEIIDQEQEWRGQDRTRNQQIEDEKMRVWRDDVNWTKEERDRARKEQDRLIGLRDAELAARNETLDNMLSPKAPRSEGEAAPTERDPYAVPPPVPLTFGNLDAPAAMTDAPASMPVPQPFPAQPGNAMNPSLRPAPVLDAPVPVPPGWRADTPSPPKPQRPQDRDADPEAQPEERRSADPPSREERSLMDQAVDASRQNARAGKASDGPRDRAPVTARPEQGPPPPREMSIMDAALRAAQLNALREAEAGQTNGRPLAPQGERPGWLPEDYLLPPENGPQVNQQAPVQGQPTGPQGARPAWLPETALPGDARIAPAGGPNRPVPPAAGIGRGAPMPPQAPPPAPAQGTMVTQPPQAAPQPPQVPTTEEGTPVASVAVAAATSPPQSANLSFGIVGKDAAVKATPAQFDRAAKAGAKAYTETEMPKIVEFYLRQGKVAEAQAFEAFVKDKRTQAGIAEYMRAAHALNLGDEKTALKAIAGTYNSYLDDGYTALPDESDLVWDETGALAGGVMVFRNDETGELVRREFQNGKGLLQAVIGAISPEAAFEAQVKELFADGAALELTPTQTLIYREAMKALSAQSQKASEFGDTSAAMTPEEMHLRALAVAKGAPHGDPAPASGGLTPDDIDID